MSYGVGGLVAGLITGFLITKFFEKHIILFFFGFATIGLMVLY